MAGYLGAKPAVNGIYTVDEFTSSGGTTYTLSRAPGTKNNIQVNAGGLAQYPSAYSVSGTTLTLSGVPSGQKVVVRHMGETILYPVLDAGQVAYDIRFTAGFNSSMVKENVAVRTYDETIMARAGTFVGEVGYIDTAATIFSCVVDIQKNGSSIYSQKPEFASGSNSLTAGTLSVTTFAIGDRITFKIDAIGNVTAGQGVRFTLKGKI
jgi:hypothetical protein